MLHHGNLRSITSCTLLLATIMLEFLDHMPANAACCCLLPLLIEGLQSSCFATSRKPSELK